MVEKFIKFIEKSPIKNVLLAILRDIYNDRLDGYDVKPMQWYKDVYRLRKWTIRFIFRKTKDWNRILKIDNRWDIYKWEF